MKLKDYLYFNRIPVTRFAKKLGISRSYMCLVVNGKYKPSARIAKLIEEGTEGNVCHLDLML